MEMMFQVIETQSFSPSKNEGRRNKKQYRDIKNLLLQIAE